MALGFQFNSGDGADFLPIVKMDSRAGRIFRVDRSDGVSTPHDITRNFRAVFDFENMEVGFISFAAGAAPTFQMVKFGDPMPAKSNPDAKQGVRIIVKLSKECGGDVREFASTASAFLRGFDPLHDAYLAGLAQNPGKLPVVALKDTIAVKSGKGEKTSTNYQPVFEIISWCERPKDLVASPRGGASEPAASAPKATPPSTGATRVDPPKAAAPVEEKELEDEFG
jgi:hypothetical protein